MRWMRWCGWAFGAVLGLALVACAVVYGLSAYQLSQTSPSRAAAVPIPHDAASIDEGRRLSMVHGCQGCHGASAQGNLLFDEPLIARIEAPNLTYSVRHYSGSDIATAIRYGVSPRTGKTMIVMPSQAFAPLSDADLGRILAYVWSQPQAMGFEGAVSIGPVGRLGLLAGQYRTSLQLVQEARAPAEPPTPEAATGRYLARTSCAQCHAADLGGASHPEGIAPSLRMVAAYTPEAFTALLRTGVGLGNRKLGVMTGWAKAYFSHFTDAEIQALYRYLHDMPEPVRP